MFDTVRVQVPLPDPAAQDLEFRTKDLDCAMDHYTINPSGRLIRHAVEWEPTPENELPYKDDPRPFMRMCGSMRVKAGSERDVDMDYHGWLNFYGDRHTGEAMLLAPRTGEDALHPGPSPEWFEYAAKFTDGTLVSIQRGERPVPGRDR